MAARNNPIGGGKGMDKVWSDALRRAVFRPGDTNKKLKRIEIMADQCAKMAEKGDMMAIKEIGDRLDGKPHQSVAVNAEIRDRVVSKKPLSDEDWQAKYGAGIDAPKGNGDGRNQ